MTAVAVFSAGGFREGVRRTMLNGNFWKGSTLLLMLIFGASSIWQQTNYSRLEERIAGQSIVFQQAIQSLRNDLVNAAGLNATIQTEIKARQDKMRDQIATLSVELERYKNLPKEVDNATKDIQQARAQINMILFRWFGAGNKTDGHTE